MNNRRGLLILGIPLAAGLLLAGLLVFRSSRDADLPPLRKEREEAPLPSRPQEISAAPARTAKPKIASDDKIAKATDEARVRSTYQNFRTAVATGNRTLEDALRPVILRDRDFAIDLARQEMATATEQTDREIAQKTLEALRR